MFFAILVAQEQYDGCYSTDSYMEYVPNLKQVTLHLIKGPGATEGNCDKFPLGVDVQLQIVIPNQPTTIEEKTFNNFSFASTTQLMFDNLLLSDSISLVLVSISTYAEITTFEVSELLSVEFSIANCFSKATVLLEEGQMTFTGNPTGLCTSQLATVAPEGLVLVELQLQEEIITIDDAVFMETIRDTYESLSLGGVMSVVHTNLVYEGFYMMQINTGLMRFVCMVGGKQIKAEISINLVKKHAVIQTALAWFNSSAVTILINPALTAIPSTVSKVAFNILFSDQKQNDQITFAHFSENLEQRYLTAVCAGSPIEVQHCLTFMENIGDVSKVSVDIAVKYYEDSLIIDFDRLDAEILSGVFSRAIMSLRKDNLCASLREDILFEEDEQLSITVKYYSPLVVEMANDGIIVGKENVTTKVDKLCFDCDDACENAYQKNYMFSIEYGNNGLFSLEKETKSYLVVQILSFLVGCAAIIFALVYSIMGVIYLHQKLKASKKKKLK